jgi:hypothetical protein
MEKTAPLIVAAILFIVCDTGGALSRAADNLDRLLETPATDYSVPEAHPVEYAPGELADTDYCLPDYIPMQWNMQADLPTAVIYEADQIAQLPLHTEAVVLSGVRIGCFGMVDHIGEESIAALERLPNLRSLVIAIRISDAGVEALTRLPALEVLCIAGFSKLTSEQLRKLEALPLKHFQHSEELSKHECG